MRPPSLLAARELLERDAQQCRRLPTGPPGS